MPPVKAPLTVSVFPLPMAKWPDVKVSADEQTVLLPNVAEPPPFIRKVTILFVVPAVVWLKNIVPNAPVAPIVRLDDALPVKYCVDDIPETVPFSVNVKPPIVSVFAAPVKVKAPVIVAFPPIVKFVPPALLNSRLPSVTAALAMLFAVPVIVILPPVLLV